MRKLLARHKRGETNNVKKVNSLLARKKDKIFRSFRQVLRVNGYVKEARQLGSPWKVSSERAVQYTEDLKLYRERIRGIVRMIAFWNKRIDQIDHTDRSDGGVSVISRRLAYERGKSREGNKIG